MIDWGEAPDGSRARIYWPAVRSSDVLTLAARLYPNHLLSAADAHTIECKAGGGVAYVPIPAGGNQSLAGLLTVELPSGIEVGNQFEVVVRRITSRRPVDRRVAALPTLSGAAVAQGQLVADWRYVVGTFAMRIPVRQESAILPEEEDLLAILKWRLSIVSSADRWLPVLHRYIDYVSARVNGMEETPRRSPPLKAVTIPRRAQRLATQARAARTAAPARSRVLSTIVSATSKGSSSKRKRGRRAPSRAPDRRSRRWSGARGWNGSC